MIGGTMKKEYQGNILNPLPVVLVGTLVNGRPNYCVVGYIAPFNFGKHIFLSMYKKRYTYTGIDRNRTFSVNVPSEDSMKELEICGSKSGGDVDKSALFTTFYGELKTAPMIDECPLTVECEVTDIVDYDPSQGIIGRVIRSYATADLFDEGILNMKRARLLVWTTGADFSYYKIGERITVDDSAA
jgi:flavin reductase (DIM6/NTAB) family NADH-FMN oxidoreductase RutF